MNEALWLISENFNQEDVCQKKYLGRKVAELQPGYFYEARNITLGRLWLHNTSSNLKEIS